MLVLVRHGESEWNKLNRFTGWHDVDLSPRGIEEAHKAGQALKEEGIAFDIAFTSALKRAQVTLDIILEQLGQSGIPIEQHEALNERDYGELAGLNKDAAREQWGDQQVYIWRRSFDTPPPGGESLRDTAERVLPYYEARILPQLTAGKAVIVSAHGNSLRALIMALDGLSREEITELNLATGVPIIYRISPEGAAAGKRELTL